MRLRGENEEWPVRIVLSSREFHLSVHFYTIFLLMVYLGNVPLEVMWERLTNDAWRSGALLKRNLQAVELLLGRLAKESA